MPSCKASRGGGPSWSAALEDDALDRLVTHLRRSSHEAEVVARPDREGRSGRAVDAELVIDGRGIAVEITQLLPGARAHYEIARLERRIEAELAPIAVDRHLGYVAISVHYRKLPPKSALRTAVPVLIADIADAMRRLKPDPRVRTELEVETEVAFIRRLELLQLPGAKPGLGWIGGSDEFGGWIDPMADAFVEALLEGKASQADGYAEAWVVIVDRVGLVDAKNIAEALTRSSRTVPANWTRLWFMPATDRERVIAIAIPGRASMNE